MPIDLREIEAHRDTLRCPVCGTRARQLLLTIADRRPVCERCARRLLKGRDA